MNEKTYYTAEEVAEKYNGDAQTLRNWVKRDISDGTNKSNWDARMSGNKILFSKSAVDDFFKNKMRKPVGPVIKFTSKGAEWLIKNGFAVEVQDDQS